VERVTPVVTRSDTPIAEDPDMHRSNCAVVAAILCGATLVAPPARSQARSADADRRAVIALENEWLLAEDSATLARILAPDFVHPVLTGDFLTKAQHLHWFSGHPRPANAKVRFAGLDVRLYGDVAIVTGTVISTGAPGQQATRTVFTDVFAYRPDRWQAVNAQENGVGTPRGSRETPCLRVAP